MAVGNVEATTAWTQLALVYTGMEQRGSGSMGFPQACECQMDKYPGNWPKSFSVVDFCMYGLCKQRVKAK